MPYIYTGWNIYVTVSQTTRLKYLTAQVSPPVQKYYYTGQHLSF